MARHVRSPHGRSTLARRFAFPVFLLLASAVDADAQTTATATLTQWDIFTATGGNGTATQNVASILRDPGGAAGPAGSVWITTQVPEPRLARLDPDGTVNNYTEWRPLAGDPAAGGAPLGLALNSANGDLWVSIQGVPSLLLKPGGSNTFRRFDGIAALTPQGLAVAADGSLYVALPETNMYGQGKAIIRVPRDLTNESLMATVWRFDQSPAGEPKYLAVDASGNVWFTDRANNVVARLNPSTGTVTEWPLPSGSSPMGLQLSGSTACMISDGLVPQTGVVQCLNTATNQVTVFAQAAEQGLNRPQQLARNSFAELFVTEWNGNAVVFIAQQAYDAATVVTVTPTSRTRPTSSLELFGKSVTAAPIQWTVPKTATTFTGTDIGNGQTRFALPSASLTYPFPLTGYPQPFGITAAFNDVERGSGTAFLAEYFRGPIGQYAAARISKLEVVAAPAIVAIPGSLQFAATIGSAAPGSQAIAISEASALSLDWTATTPAPWLTLSPSSGTAPSSLTVSSDHATLTAGTYTATIAIDDGPGRADPKNISVTFTVEEPAPAAIEPSPATITFTALRGGSGPAAQTLTITNSGARPLVWTATPTESWLQIAPAAGTVAPGGSAALSVTALHGSLQKGVYNGAIAISDPAASNSPQQVAVTLNVTAPTIALSPSSVNLTVGQGGSVSEAVTVSNTGDGALTFTPSVTASGGTWLSVSPAGSTTVAPGGSVTLTVTAASGSLAAGSYNGTITVADSAATNSSQTIAVSLTVNASGAIALTPPDVSLTASQGGSNPANRVVTVSNTGAGSFDYTASVDAGASWLSIAAGGSGTLAPSTDAPLTLSANISGLVKGTYVGTVQVAGTNAGNSPQSITVTLTIQAPTISPTPTAISVTAVRTAASPANRTVGVGNTGDGPLSYTATVTSGGSWASIASGGSGTVAPSGSGTLTLAFNTGALAKGVYTATVQIADPTATNSSQTVTITLTVTAPTIGLLPASLAFSAVVGGNPASKTIAVSNSGDAPLNYSAAPAGGGWLSVSPASGTVLPGQNATLAVSVASSALAIGSYSGTISVSDPTATNATQVASVALSVTPDTSFSLSPASLYFNTGRLAYCNGVPVGSNWKDQGLVVTNTGGVTLNYAASTATGWIRISPASGSLAPGATTTLTVSVDITGRSQGVYQGTVTITGNGSVVQNAPVTLEVGNAAPTLCLTPTTQSFGTVRANKTSTTLSFSVTNVGDDPLGSWSSTKTATQGTINMSATSGTGPKTISISVKTNQVKGSQQGTITVTSPGAAQSSQAVALAWTVK